MEEKKISLVEALNQAFTLRKYYLLRRVKKCYKVRPYKMEVVIPADKTDDIPRKQQAYMKELCDSYGYSIQVEIPGGGKITKPVTWNELNHLSNTIYNERSQIYN